MSIFWIQTPSDDVLSEMRGWAKIGENKYAAIRHHLLVVPRSGSKAKNGPIHKQMDWPVGAKFHMEDKITKVTKFTYGIEESITSTVTTKLTQEVISKIGLSTGLDISNLGAKLSAEVQTKIGTELVESLQSGLSTTKTYEVETKTEQTESLDIVVAASDGSTAIRPVFIHFKLRQLFWDVYLYRTEYLQLEYRERWYWKDVRRTIISDEVLVKKPLFRVAYFEPESAFSFKYDSYEPEVDDGDIVQSLSITSNCPTANLQPKKTMEELARLAFPVSKAEKNEAKETRRRIGGTKGGAKAGAAKGYSKGRSYGGSKGKSSKSFGSKGSKISRGSSKSRGGSRGSGRR